MVLINSPLIHHAVLYKQQLLQTELEKLRNMLYITCYVTIPWFYLIIIKDYTHIIALPC